MSVDARKKTRGRPEVDTEELRARVERPVIDALEAYATGEAITRPQAIRAILADWLRTHGFRSDNAPKPKGPATEAVEAMETAIKGDRSTRKK